MIKWAQISQALKERCKSRLAKTWKAKIIDESLGASKGLS